MLFVLDIMKSHLSQKEKEVMHICFKRNGFTSLALMLSK